ncbi:MAG TPA: ribbon-helix-helix domain-containing protein [Alphaproteobacteria bacterium]|jgi:predicted DNA-binding ribbon-helix-helix protein
MTEFAPGRKTEALIASANGSAKLQGRRALTIRNIVVEGQRTTIRLEAEMWEALHEIAVRENCQVNDLCSFVHETKKPGSSLTAAIRVFVMMYFKSACTEDGHRHAGHGDFKALQFNYIRVMEGN